MENDEQGAVTMPYERPSERESDAASAASNALRTPTVLVVDDEPLSLGSSASYSSAVGWPC